MSGGERELLEQALASQSQIEVSIASGWYACCSRGWHPLAEPLHFTGRILTLGATDVMFVKDGIGTITLTVAAPIAEVSSVRFASS